MKKQSSKPTIAALALLATVLFACKKEEAPLSIPVEFPTTQYNVLTPYDSVTGRPLSVLKDTVPADMLAYIKKMLPEKQDLRQTNPQLLEYNPTADLWITDTADVYLTFVSTVTAYKNAIAFYTYPSSTPPKSPADIKTITYVFANAGVGTKLKAGDKLKLGRFAPGTSIGLVLLRDAFDPTTGALNNKGVHFCYNDALNPEVDPGLKKHVVVFSYQHASKLLIGFEDINRTAKSCDHDFNDAVLYATIVN